MGGRAAERDHRLDDGDLVRKQVVSALGPRPGPAVADEIGGEHAIAVAQMLDEWAPLAGEARRAVGQHHALAAPLVAIGDLDPVYA